MMILALIGAVLLWLALQGLSVAALVGAACFLLLATRKYWHGQDKKTTNPQHRKETEPVSSGEGRVSRVVTSNGDRVRVSTLRRERSQSRKEARGR
jgi:hypothetical protein